MEDNFEDPKIKQLAELLEIRADLRNCGKTTILTDGGYDYMHEGHVDCFRKAKKLGDILIVGVGSNESVQRMKGVGRPLRNQDRRAFFLSELASIDYLFMCADENITNYIKLLQPDIYVKGGDYTLETMNQEERRTTEEYSGKIVIVPSFHDLPSTSIVDKALRAYFSKHQEQENL